MSFSTRKRMSDKMSVLTGMEIFGNILHASIQCMPSGNPQADEKSVAVHLAGEIKRALVNHVKQSKLTGCIIKVNTEPPYRFTK